MSENTANAATQAAETVSTNATVVTADIAEPRFDNVPPGTFDIVFDMCREDNGEHIEISLECSTAMCGFKQDECTRIEFSAKVLQAIGYTHGDDFSQIEELVGKSFPVYGKKQFSKTGKAYWSWNFSTQRRRVKVSAKDLSARVKAMREQIASRKSAPASSKFDPFA